MAVFVPATFVTGSEQSPIALPLTQEQGAGFVFIGSMSLWCWRRPCWPLHGWQQTFWALFGGIHWAAHFQGERTIVSLLVNSLPLPLMLLAAGSVGGSRAAPVDTA